METRMLFIVFYWLHFSDIQFFNPSICKTCMALPKCKDCFLFASSEKKRNFTLQNAAFSVWVDFKSFRFFFVKDDKSSFFRISIF